MMRWSCGSLYIHLVFLVLWTVCELVEGFVVDVRGPLRIANSSPSSASLSLICFASQKFSVPSTSSLMAKKRRRRKESSDSEDSSSTLDLPDFDLADDPATDSSPSPPEMSPVDRVTTPSKSAASNKPSKSLQELITDRSLEKKLIFANDNNNEDAVDAAGQTLPDLMAASRPNESVTTTTARNNDKRVRQAARRAELAAQEKEKRPEENRISQAILSKLPTVVDDEGNIQPVKLLELGAWIGIFLLVAWELYINSPFFQRAAPMAPIVYQFFL